MEEATKLKDYLKPEVIFIKKNFNNQKELFQTIYKQAYNLGWVRADFINRIIEREQNFPTGIQLENLGAAIPHTDPECVLKEFVAVITIQEPVDFKRMDDVEKTVKTKIVFVLGLNRPHAQLEMLQSLMGLLQNQTILTELIDSDSPENLLTIIKNYDL